MKQQDGVLKRFLVITSRWCLFQENTTLSRIACFLNHYNKNAILESYKLINETPFCV